MKDREKNYMQDIDSVFPFGSQSNRLIHQVRRLDRIANSNFYNTLNDEDILSHPLIGSNNETNTQHTPRENIEQLGLHPRRHFDEHLREQLREQLRQHHRDTYMYDIIYSPLG